MSIHGDQDLGANNVSIFKAELKLVSPEPKDPSLQLREDPLQKVRMFLKQTLCLCHNFKTSTMFV